MANKLWFAVEDSPSTSTPEKAITPVAHIVSDEGKLILESHAQTF